MTCQNATGEDLRKTIGYGTCFVALLDGKVIGTTSVNFVNLNRWWSKKQSVAYYSNTAVLPEFRGTDVYIEMTKLMSNFVKESGVRLHQFNTAEQNKAVIKMNERFGYKKVQYSATGKGADYYSVIMCKWDDGCPYSDRFCNFMFKLSRFVVKALWKPGYKFRYWIN